MSCLVITGQGNSSFLRYSISDENVEVLYMRKDNVQIVHHAAFNIFEFSMAMS